jgi:DNA ligase-1
MSTFYDLAALGEQLAATKKKLEHSALIGAYLKHLPPDEIAPAARLIIGRVFPETDSRILNLSGSAVGRVLETLVGAPLDWSGDAVDFGDAVERWLNAQGWKSQGQPLQLLDVYHAYEEIAERTGVGSRESKDTRLTELFSRASSVEAKYIVKHLTKEMRVGVSEGSLLDALARTTGIPGATIRRANQVAGDVGAVARAAVLDGEHGLARLALQLGRPLKPMLAQSAETVAGAFEKMSAPQNGAASFALEYKLDGARVQIHKRGDEIQLFSRHLSDITISLPEIAEQARREILAHDAIVEGEVIAIDANGRSRPFQILMRRVGRERDIEVMQREIPVQLFLFDCLYRDGEILLDHPNSERWEALRQIAGAIDLVPRVIPENIAQGEALLQAARAAGHEGLMAKQLASPYTPGERGKSWLKIKPVITLDLVIVASDWGYGRRHGWLSNQHLAARDAESGEFLEVGKTFKGLTDAEFKMITDKLLALKLRQARGTVWVKPQIVVEVAFNNIQRSPVYKSGVALRHARILSFRPDKPVEEIETVQTLRELMRREEAGEGAKEKERENDTELL